MSNKLKDKFAGLDLSVPAAPKAQEPRTMATAVGLSMGDTIRKKSEMLLENERLKEEVQRWDGASPSKLLDPNLIVRGPFANRHLDNFSTDEFYALKADIAAEGRNVQAIKVRPISGGRYEIVFGHRRHEACRQLGIKVVVVIEDIDDQRSFVEMELENRAQKRLSPWEQGKTYLRALEMGIYSSNKQLARAINVDPANLGRYVELAKLPDEVVAAFSSPLDLQQPWAGPLKKAVESDEAAVMRKAAAIKAMPVRPAAKEIFMVLVQEASPVAAKKYQSLPIHANDVVVGSIARKGKSGAVLKLAHGLDEEKTSKLVAFIATLFR